RPRYLPSVLALATPSRWRSSMIFRSNSAKDPVRFNMSLPVRVVIQSIASTCNSTPLALRARDLVDHSRISLKGRTIMTHLGKMAMVVAGTLVGASTTWADTLLTHRIPAALAVEAASETVAACAKQGYHETAVVLDADGATIVTLRGDGAGIHTLDSAHDKA